MAEHGQSDRWAMSRLPARQGPRPRTSTQIPHQQLDQQPTDPAVCEELATRVFALPEVVDSPSAVSLPGARALVLAPGRRPGPPEAFLVDRELGHLHPPPDASLHLALPTADAERAIELGWAEWHPHAVSGRWPRTIVMAYAPRDLREVDAVELLVRRSVQWASGCAG